MIEKVEWDKRSIEKRGWDLFELSLVNGFMDSPASRAKVRFPSSPFFFRSQGSPISFFLHPGLFARASLGLSMQPRCGRSCHCSGDRYPSSRLRAKVTTLYLESQLMPPPLSRDHPLIIDEPPSAPVLTQLLRNLSLPPSFLPAVRRPSESAWRRSTHLWKTEIGDPDNENDLSIVRRAR